MQTRLSGIITIALILTLSTTPMASATKPSEFSASMMILDTTGQTEIEKLSVGKGIARLDRSAPAAEPSGISSFIIDFDHQLLFLLIPQSKVYLQIAGSNGIPFYQGAYMFRPQSPDNPCGGWVDVANSRGITLRCKSAGQDTIAGRTMQKWDAATPDGGQGSLWYDADLNFVIKVRRISKDGTQSGYELKDIKQGAQPPNLFDIPPGYRQFTLNRLFDVLTKFSQW
jgi:hypothetical protein